MKQGWEYKQLGEVCNILNGYAFKSSKYTNSGTRIIRITNVQKGYVIDNDPKYYSDDDIKNLTQYSLFEGDLVMSLTGNVGRVGLLQRSMLPAALNQRVACLRTKSDEISLNYLFHLLNSDTFERTAIQSARGMAQLNMSTEWLKEYCIPLPPKSTQLAIVFELDKINELIRLKKEQLKDFDNLAQSIFYEMFGDPVENEMGWEVKRISNIAKYHNGVAHEKDVDKDGEFILVNAKFISSEGKIRKKTNIQHFPLFRNDVVMVLSDLPNGKSLAKCFLIDEDKKYSLNQRICCFRGFEGSAIFLKYVINRNPYLLLFDNGKSQTNLRKGDVEKMPIPLPPLPLQHLFAQRIEQIEHQKAEVQKAIADLETLLASRMQYWFE